MITADHRLATLLLALVLVLLVPACEAAQGPEALRVAVMLDEAPSPARVRYFEWAAEQVNAAGGVAGRPLAVDYFRVDDDDPSRLGLELAEDADYLAVIAPPGDAALSLLAPLFVEAGKPLLSTSSSAEELFRDYAALDQIWRLRDADVAQVELLVRHAREQGAGRVAMLADVGVTGGSARRWFEFFAKRAGYAGEGLAVASLAPGSSCAKAVAEVLAAVPELVFVTAASVEQVACVLGELPPGASGPRLVVAETGLEPADLLALGPGAEGLEGFALEGEIAFEAAASARAPELERRAHGSAEYDAILLLAYGLERSEGVGGLPLIAGMEAVVDAREASVGGWDRAGVAQTLAALEADAAPQIRGASGPWAFDADRYMDLRATDLARYVIEAGALRYGARVSTGDRSLLSHPGALEPSSTAGPAGPARRPETWAVIAALSSGWDNYRHQADALRQYQLLRARGVDDEHIVLILADDLATSPDNELPGIVRNQPGGPDLHAGVLVDYDLSLSAQALRYILTGQVTASTPEVISPQPGSEVYLYFVGHGGPSGIPIDAQTAQAGLDGAGELLSPGLLREALCASRGQRGPTLIVVESCFAGVFGEASSGGLELGCEDTPLADTTLISAAEASEVSWAGELDLEVPAWVNDEFSASFASKLGVERSLADIYVDSYRATLGSHPALYGSI